MQTGHVLTALLLLLLQLTSLASCLKERNGTEGHVALIQLAQRLPSCILSCAMKHAPPDCPMTSMKCVCQPPNAATQDCSFQQCKGWDIIVGSRLTLEACGVPPPRDDIPLMAQLWASTAVCVMVVGMCLAARLFGDIGRPGWDDACAAIALCCLVVTVSGTQDAVAHGMGRGVFVDSPDDISTATRWFFIRSILFFWTAAACKASLLFQFGRVFTSHGVDPVWRLPFCRQAWSFRMVLVCTHAVNMVSCLSFTIFALVQCEPMSYYWTKWMSTYNGSCIVNKRYPSFGHSILGVILDFWILLLPLTLISTLRMSLWTKIGAASMFCLGTLVTIISFIRVIVLMKDLKVADLRSNYIAVTTWSQAEMATAIVCACLIPAKQFCFRVMPIPFRRLNQALQSLRRRRQSAINLGSDRGDGHGEDQWQQHHDARKLSAGGGAALGKHSYSRSEVSEYKDGKSVVVDVQSNHV